MFRLTRREQIIVISFLVLILVASGVYMYGRPGPVSQVPLPRADVQGQTDGTANGRQETVPAKQAAEIKVDVKGAVRTPGVYTLPAGSRVIDAIREAGGNTEQADLQSLNLAQKLPDGGLVNVPVQGEPAGAAKGFAPPDGKLNLNTATVEQLDALEGIGSTRAKAIVEYREKQGPFQSVDDLQKVKGFGPKLVETIRDKLAVY